MGTVCPAREPAQPRHCCRDMGTFPSPHQLLKLPRDLWLLCPQISLPLSPSAASWVSLTRGCRCLRRFAGHDERLEDPRAELRARLSAVERSRGSMRVPRSSAPPETLTPLGQEPATLTNLLRDWGNSTYPGPVCDIMPHHQGNGCDVRASQLGWGLPALASPFGKPWG